jgi:hypothetical protein
MPERAGNALARPELDFAGAMVVETKKSLLDLESVDTAVVAKTCICDI